jgi:hypothetical protein
LILLGFFPNQAQNHAFSIKGLRCFFQPAAGLTSTFAVDLGVAPA